MRPSRQNEQGSILVLALLVSLVLLGFGLAVMWVASSGARTSANINRRQEALYAAEAGAERARIVLTQASAWDSSLLGGCSCSPEDDRDGKGYVLCQAGACLRNVQVVDSTTQTWTTASDPGLANIQYTIWVRNDWQEECDSTASAINLVDCDGNGIAGEPADVTGALTDGNGRLIVQVEGRARDGLSTVRLEVIVTRATKSSTGKGYQQGGLNSGGTNSI